VSLALLVRQRVECKKMVRVVFGEKVKTGKSDYWFRCFFSLSKQLVVFI
jgi:hypothetical protein